MNAIAIKAVSPLNPDVRHLINQLDAYQIDLYGIEKCNLETPEALVHNQAYMIGAYAGDALIGIGGIKIYDTYAEVKRMFVDNKFRGKAIARLILEQLENYALRKGITKVFLETGKLHVEALGFYRKNGYSEVEKFGEYFPNEVSVYFSKEMIVNHVSPERNNYDPYDLETL
jgi:putative acetyltransferase